MKRSDSFWPKFDGELRNASTLKASPARMKTAEEILEDIVIGQQQLSARIAGLEQLARHTSIYSKLIGYEEITTTDVVDEFAKLPDFSRASAEAEATACLRSLIQNNVRTREQLRALVQSGETLTWLRDTYRDVLLRKQEFPLDPLAVAVWGASLFANGNDESVKRHIRSLLMNSKERQSALGEKQPT